MICFWVVAFPNHFRHNSLRMPNTDYSFQKLLTIITNFCEHSDCAVHKTFEVAITAGTTIPKSEFFIRFGLNFYLGTIATGLDLLKTCPSFAEFRARSFRLVMSVTWYEWESSLILDHETQEQPVRQSRRLKDFNLIWIGTEKFRHPSFPSKVLHGVSASFDIERIRRCATTCPTSTVRKSGERTTWTDLSCIKQPV